MMTAIQTDLFTTAEERAQELLLNAFRGEVVTAGLSAGLAEALRVISFEEGAGRG